MAITRLALILYFHVVDHKAAYHLLPKAFEIKADMAQILLMFVVFFTQLSHQPIQDHFQHVCARMTDEADSCVVLLFYRV